MDEVLNPRVKICCINNVGEAKFAIRCGASDLGFVTEMPSGPGVISLNLIANIVSSIPPAIGTFLLTSKQSINEIIKQHNYCRTNAIQIVDCLTEGSHEDLKKGLPGISIVQVIHVTGEESIDEALSVEDHVDAILLDSGNRHATVKELGGTGRAHNWNISKKIRAALKIPIFLAGGLTPENIAAAIDTVRPFGVDVCSGVRANGHLDKQKCIKFFNRVYQN